MYFVTTLAGLVIGLSIMKVIQKFFKWEKEMLKPKVVNEKPYFKDNFVRYYTKTLADHTLEFWAFPMPEPFRDDGRVTYVKNSYGDKHIYLGKFKEGDLEVEKPENFWSLPRPITRGAIKLYMQSGVYE